MAQDVHNAYFHNLNSVYELMVMKATYTRPVGDVPRCFYPRSKAEDFFALVVDLAADVLSLYFFLPDDMQGAKEDRTRPVGDVPRCIDPCLSATDYFAIFDYRAWWVFYQAHGYMVKIEGVLPFYFGGAQTNGGLHRCLAVAGKTDACDKPHSLFHPRLLGALFRTDGAPFLVACIGALPSPQGRHLRRSHCGQLTLLEIVLRIRRPSPRSWFRICYPGLCCSV